MLTQECLEELVRLVNEELDSAHVVFRDKLEAIDTPGGAEGTRTPDFLRAREALSQLSYSPTYQGYYSNKRSHSQFDEVPQ